MIIIVDDDEAMADTCSMLLEAHGFEVSTACSGAEALSRIKGEPHELVISGCVMPGMSGLELSEKVKEDPVTADVPVLLMSGAPRGQIADGVSYDAFLRKPFLAENLLSEVRKLLAGELPAPIIQSKV